MNTRFFLLIGIVLFPLCVSAAGPATDSEPASKPTSDAASNPTSDPESDSQSNLTLAPSIGVRLGSLGLGIEGGFDITEQFSLRLGMNRFQFEESSTVAYIKYNLDLEWNSISLLADWHPFKGPLRLTGGFFKNGNEIHGKTATPSLTIGNTYYEGAGLEVDVDFKPIAPYLGLGWEYGLFGKRGLSVNFDLGVLYQGSGNVKLRATGIAADIVAQEDIAYEERQFEEEIKDYRYYPVFALGISYLF
jgi:hypothetical protein